MKSIPLVSQCMLIGDGRKYCMHIYIGCGSNSGNKHGMDRLKYQRSTVQISTLESFGKTLADYTESEEIHAEMQAHVTELNGQFSNPEQIKNKILLEILV